MANKIEKQFLDTENKGPVRLNKYLSEAGVCSRREADKLIAAGQVTVDGVRAETGMKVEPWQVVRIGKKQVSRQEEMIVLAVNKPRGIVCTEERRERDSIVRFLNYPVRITYVGRLDKDTEGLLLITNDGELAHRLLSPKKHVDKEYYVRVAGRLSAADSAAFAEGLHLDDGLICQPAELRILTAGEESEAYVILREGKFHQIKRMLAYLGKPVLYLERVRMGNLLLDPVLERGTYRLLTKEEWQALAKLTEETRKPRNFNKKESDFLLKKENISCILTNSTI